MQFNSFVESIPHRLANPPENLIEMMGSFFMGDRIKMLKANPNPRQSAIMVLIYNKNQEAHFALIERPTYDGVHSGQIAFPGGSMDKEDENLEVTAFRELYEEVGVKNNIKIMGSLSEVYIPPSKFLVTPFIGVSQEAPEFVKDDFEVEQIIEVPVSMLFDDSIIKKGSVKVGQNNLTMKVPYFDIYGHMVWGATAIILSEFKAIFK